MGAKNLMPKIAIELGALAVSRLTEPGLHFVGGVPGLALQVLPSGARTWVLRATVGGKRREMGLGGYSSSGMNVARAREDALAARKKIKAGIDPIGERRANNGALRAAQAKELTFKAAASAYIEAHEAGWKNAKHRQQWENTLTAHAFGKIGELTVQAVELPHVLSVLEPIWRDKTETASRLRGRIEQVLDWATARGYRVGLNPARWRGHLDKLLPKPSKVVQVEHHRALGAASLGQFMFRLRAVKGLGARALEFAIFTAARSGEVRGATWDEINFDEKVWTIPPERMKAAREHRVPLSDAALKLLNTLPRPDGASLVFQAARGGELSDMTLSAVLRRMVVPAVPHGFRSTFRDWAGERTSYPREVVEMALAHAIGNQVERAYARGDLFDKRRHLMNDWARFCLSTVASVNLTVLVIENSASPGA